MYKLLLITMMLFLLIQGTIANSNNIDPGIVGQINKFEPNDRVWATTDVKVRSDPGLSSTQINSLSNGNSMIKGNMGTVREGPATKDGYNWWKIEYDIGIAGWSAENYIEPIPDGPKQPENFKKWSDDAIIWATDKDRIGSKAWNGECLRFVSNAFRQKDVTGESGYASAADAARAFYRFNQEQDGWQHAPRGAIIFFNGKGTNQAGHVGIYLGDGKNIINAYGTVEEIPIDDVVEKADVGKYIGWSYPPETWKPKTPSESKSTPSNETTQVSAFRLANANGDTINNVRLSLYTECGCKDGASLSGVRVTGQDASGTLFDVTTDINGYASIEGSPGSWQFTASKEGYVTNPWTMPVTESDTKYSFLLNDNTAWISKTDTTRTLSNEELMRTVITIFPEGDVPGKSGESIRTTAYAVAKAESGGNPSVWGDKGLGDSLGLWQINLCWHPEYKGHESELFDPEYNARAALDISSDGTRWTPWSTWKNGDYKQYLQEAKDELDKLSGITPTVTLTLYVHEGSAKGATIQSALVTGHDASGSSFQQITNSKGYVTITGDPGTWSFSVSADGYETNDWDQDITENDTKDAFLRKGENKEYIRRNEYVDNSSATVCTPGSKTATCSAPDSCVDCSGNCVSSGKDTGKGWTCNQGKWDFQPTSLSELGAYRNTFSGVSYDTDASMVVANVRYDKGIKLNNGFWGYECIAYFNLNGEYSHLTGLVGLDDSTGNSKNNVTLNISSEKNVLQTVIMRPGDLPVNVDIDVSGVHILTVETADGQGNRIIDLIYMELRK